MSGGACGPWSSGIIRINKNLRHVSAQTGGPELLYIRFTRKEQTSLPAVVLKAKFRNSEGLILITLGFYLESIRKL